MKKNIRQVCLVALALVLMVGAIIPPAQAASDYTYRGVYYPDGRCYPGCPVCIAVTNVAYSSVSNNAGDGYAKHPTGLYTVQKGKEIYFNFQVDNGTKIKSVSLYITPPGGSTYKYGTKTANNYLRYTWFWYSTSGRKTGTYSYYMNFTYTNGRTDGIGGQFKLK